MATTMTTTIQSVADTVRTMPSVVPVLGIGGLSLQPALSIAQATICEILSQPLAWKWNRGFFAEFLVNAYQQDYATSVTNAAWLEKATKTDATQPLSATSGPQPIKAVSVVKDLSPTTAQGEPYQVCIVPNSEAQCSTWQASTLYFANQSGKPMPSTQPIPQIRDGNGNVQVVTTYGTSGATEPTWSTTIGGTTTDGSVVWTMLDPTAACLRLNSLPHPNGNVWQFRVTYQVQPPLYTALSNMIGVPDTLAYVYRELFLAYCLRQGGDPRWVQQDQRAHQLLQQVRGGADREPDSYQLVPGRSLMY